ncbi:hypothetical protein T440DRAFT_185660 [Plenodomus tracheiphilus IPT5]|uniref:Uncharacterized protein n=1 Tax=Plenodomus tracheiphilus IPT5 TaxID=1408161 RepID=A0A6A7AZ77_9PLEO|nr:hypothetical protein T440DRAFT_185660 [Plenodomus tracheiphilus IPT5]
MATCARPQRFGVRVFRPRLSSEHASLHTAIVFVTVKPRLYGSSLQHPHLQRSLYIPAFDFLCIACTKHFGRFKTYFLDQMGWSCWALTILSCLNCSVMHFYPRTFTSIVFSNQMAKCVLPWRLVGYRWRLRMSGDCSWGCPISVTRNHVMREKIARRHGM